MQQDSSPDSSTSDASGRLTALNRYYSSFPKSGDSVPPDSGDPSLPSLVTFSSPSFSPTSYLHSALSSSVRLPKPSRRDSLQPLTEIAPSRPDASSSSSSSFPPRTLLHHTNSLLRLSSAHSLRTRQTHTSHHKQYLSLTSTLVPPNSTPTSTPTSGSASTSRPSATFRSIHSSLRSFSRSFGTLQGSLSHLRARFEKEGAEVHRLREKLGVCRVREFVRGLGERVRVAVGAGMWEDVVGLVRLGEKVNQSRNRNRNRNSNEKNFKKKGMEIEIGIGLDEVLERVWGEFEDDEEEEEIEEDEGEASESERKPDKRKKKRKMGVARLVGILKLVGTAIDSPILERIVKRVVTDPKADISEIQNEFLCLHQTVSRAEPTAMQMGDAVFRLMSDFRIRFFAKERERFGSIISANRFEKMEQCPELVQVVSKRIETLLVHLRKLDELMCLWGFGDAVDDSSRAIEFVGTEFFHLVRFVSGILIDALKQRGMGKIRRLWAGWNVARPSDALLDVADDESLRGRLSRFALEVVDGVVQVVLDFDMACRQATSGMLFRGSQPFGSDILEDTEIAKKDLVLWFVAEWLAICGGAPGEGIVMFRAKHPVSKAGVRPPVLDERESVVSDESVLLLALACSEELFPLKLLRILPNARIGWSDFARQAYLTFAARKGRALGRSLCRLLTRDTAVEPTRLSDVLLEVEQTEILLHQICDQDRRLQLVEDGSVGGGSGLSYSSQDGMDIFFRDFEIGLDDKEIGSSFAILREVLKVALRSLNEDVRRHSSPFSLEEFEFVHEIISTLQRSWRSLIPTSAVVVNMLRFVAFSGVDRCIDHDAAREKVRVAQTRLGSLLHQ